MVSERSSERERNTRDGHPEVKEEQEQHLFFLLLANTKLANHTFHCLHCTRIFAIHGSPTHLLKYMVAMSHAFFEKDGVF